MIDARDAVMVVGGGPAGLMAAEAAAAAGAAVHLFDAMPSVGRKFLLAGRGGLNLTHSEPLDAFLGRYGEGAAALRPMIEAFPPEAVRGWAAELGIATFVGSSGRVFPQDFKAAPLLRAWLRRLREAGVRFHVRKRWSGFAGDRMRFADGEDVAFGAAVLAFGGASWPNLGSDGGWVPVLRREGVAVAALEPSNCGFDLPWPDGRGFPGVPLKNVALSCAGRSVRGELVLTEYGVEGGPVYALAPELRRERAAVLDLKPDLAVDEVARRLARPRGAASLSTHLRKALGLPAAASALVRALARDLPLVQAVKALPLTLTGPRPIAEAISSAGGVRFADLDETLMLRRLPGVFAAGEMLDWEAPTGGYLLQACLSTGRWAGTAAARWLQHQRQQ